MADAVTTRLDQVRNLGAAICQAMDGEYQRLGFGGVCMPEAPLEAARFTFKRDPYSGEDSLEGVWLDQRGHRRGSILFHSEGSFYAEYDVVQPHPTDRRWFVEAVTAWGHDAAIKVEARLLASVE